MTVQPASDVPIATLVKQHNNAMYLFAVAMRNKATRCSFKVPGGGKRMLAVLGEARTLDSNAGQFSDDFPPYGVHLYRLDKDQK